MFEVKGEGYKGKVFEAKSYNSWSQKSRNLLEKKRRAYLMHGQL